MNEFGNFWEEPFGESKFGMNYFGKKVFGFFWGIQVTLSVFPDYEVNPAYPMANGALVVRDL